VTSIDDGSGVLGAGLIAHIHCVEIKAVLVLAVDMPTHRKPEYLRRLGKTIRNRRLAHKWSQEELAERMDCHRNYVGLVERAEHNVSVTMLHRLAVAFRCSIRDFFEPTR
jgi:DNA-binding XRE family transcriptional regulator